MSPEAIIGLVTICVLAWYLVQKLWPQSPSCEHEFEVKGLQRGGRGLVRGGSIFEVCTLCGIVQVYVAKPGELVMRQIFTAEEWRTKGYESVSVQSLRERDDAERVASGSGGDTGEASRWEASAWERVERVREGGRAAEKRVGRASAKEILDRGEANGCTIDPDPSELAEQDHEGGSRDG